MTEPSEVLEPSELVASFRRAAGLSQTELAEHLPVGVDMVRRIEGGSAKPSPETARALDEVLETGGAIFRAYFSRPDEDAVGQLRGQVAGLALEVSSMSTQIDSLSATVDTLTEQVRQLIEQTGPPQPGSE